MYQEIDRDGNLNKKIGKKGVILARRDNSQVVRTVYEQVTSMIFERKTKDEIEQFVYDYVSDIYRNKIELSNYVITKSIGNSADLNQSGRLGDYKVKTLPDDAVERENVLNGMDEKDYLIKCCPAHVQLAERMKKRGVPVDSGSRIEFVVTKTPKGKTLAQKIEDYEYFKRHSNVLSIDAKYYVEAMINPLDQIFKIMNFGEMMNEISIEWDQISKAETEANKPILIFDD
jgi:DNA polymerase elongation subunit (family B)